MQRGAAVSVFVMRSSAGGFSLHRRQVVIFTGQAAALRAACCRNARVRNDASVRCNSGDRREVILRLRIARSGPGTHLRRRGECVGGKEEGGGGRPESPGAGQLLDPWDGAISRKLECEFVFSICDP